MSPDDDIQVLVIYLPISIGRLILCVTMASTRAVHLFEQPGTYIQKIRMQLNQTG